MQPEPTNAGSESRAAQEVAQAQGSEIPLLPNGMYDMEKLTGGVIRNDGTADQAKLQSIEDARALEAAARTTDTPAGQTAEPPTVAEMLASFRAPDLNAAGLAPLPPEKLPPARVTDYVFPPEPEGTPETLRASVEARGWLQQSGVPVDLGNYVARELGKMLDTSGGSEADWNANIATVQSRLEGIWGKEVFAARKQALGEMINHLDRKFDGRVSEFLDLNPGILLHVGVFGQLLLHAERVKGRLR